MMKNRAVWVALLVLGVATLLMVFFVLPRVTPVKEEAAQAVSGAADTAKNAAATAETAIADAARTAGEKMGRLQAEATTAITAMKALFSAGRPPAADAFPTAKGVAKAAVSALAALDVPAGIDASLDAAMKKARDNAVRALMLIDGLPDDPAKAAGLLAAIESALSGVETPEPAPAAPAPAPAADQAADQAAGDLLPRFDVLRVEPDGSTVIPGTAAPGAKL